MTDNKNFQIASEHSDAQLGPSGSNDNVNLQQEIQAPVQDEPQKPILIVAMFQCATLFLGYVCDNIGQKRNSYRLLSRCLFFNYFYVMLLFKFRPCC